MSFNKDYLEENNTIMENISGIKNIILVMSGKGGVGKSTISANLAGFLAKEGFQTGILDIDLHGPSIPKILGLSGARHQIKDDYFEPIEYDSMLKAVSIGFLLSSNSESVIWRGPKKNTMIRQFLKQVHWGALDYLIVDSPPGTGDEQLSIIQSVGGRAQAVIVTTPQDLAIEDVRKSINFCRQMKVPILGLVENMSGLICPSCNTKIELFKSNGGVKLSEETDTPFLGKISLDPLIGQNCDDGVLTIHGGKSEINKNEMVTVFKQILDNRREL